MFGFHVLSEVYGKGKGGLQCLRMRMILKCPDRDAANRDSINFSFNFPHGLFI